MFHKRAYANDRLWLDIEPIEHAPDLGISLLLYEHESPGVY
jgi:hypothetical protein